MSELNFCEYSRGVVDGPIPAQATYHPGYRTNSFCACIECSEFRQSMIEAHPEKYPDFSRAQFPNWNWDTGRPKGTVFGIQRSGKGIKINQSPFAAAPPGGSKCRKCRCVNEYAAPNQVDGSYVCYGCRV